MSRQESAGSIRKWVEEQTEHIDVVASWESLCSTYEAMRFTDPLSDAERLGEFKWIVQNTNSFLTKIRTSLLACKDLESMAQMLGTKVVPAGRVELNDRKALVYQRLRQQWVTRSVMALQEMIRRETETEKGETDGWPDRDDAW